MRSKSDLDWQLSVERERLRRQARLGKLLAFTQYTKPDYQVNWHHLALAQFLNRFVRREVRRAMVFMPPRHGKSEMVSRRLPALIHGLYPDEHIMAATYNGDLAADMTVDVQRIMDAPYYQHLFPRSRIMPENHSGSYARNREEHELIPVGEFRPQGSYRSAGVGGSFTGRGAHWILIDDPIKNREDADSKAFRDAVWKFFTSTLRTRLEGDGSILVTLTRWHADDLAGRLLRLAKSDPTADQWEILNFPAIREDVDNESDPRLIGEALWPDKFNLKWMQSTRSTIGTRDWSALYQQKPMSEDGNLFQLSWFKYYKILPPRFDQMIQSWDFAVKDKSGSDFTVGQVWGRVGANKYLIHQVRGRWSFPMAVQKFAEVSKLYPLAYKKLVEAKANGPAVVQTLRSKISGIVEVEPKGDKVARANAVAPEFEGGNVWLPAPEIAPWINDYVAEMCGFPFEANDDQVDGTTQAIDELRKATPLYNPIAGHGSGVIY